MSNNIKIEKPTIIKVEDFRNKLIKAVNEADLSIALVKFVIDDVKHIVDEQYKTALFEEIRSYNDKLTQLAQQQEVKQTTVPNSELIETEKPKG